MNKKNIQRYLLHPKSSFNGNWQANVIALHIVIHSEDTLNHFPHDKFS